MRIYAVEMRATHADASPAAKQWNPLGYVIRTQQQAAAALLRLQNDPRRTDVEFRIMEYFNDPEDCPNCAGSAPA